MIIIDRSELRTTSAMPPVEGSHSANWLERVTGADMMISPKDTPPTESLLSYHIKNGAVLVQVKINEDLSASVGDRLIASLAKMIDIAPRAAQRALLTVGFLTEGEDGQAKINGRDVANGLPFWSVQNATEAWCERGGVLVPSLHKLSLLPEWAIRKEARLRKYLDNPLRVAMPAKIPYYDVDEDDPLQEVRLVTDSRNMAMLLPGIGVKRLVALWLHCNKSMAQVLAFLTDPDPVILKQLKLPKTTGDKVCKYLQLDEDYCLSIELKHDIRY